MAAVKPTSDCASTVDVATGAVPGAVSPPLSAERAVASKTAMVADPPGMSGCATERAGSLGGARAVRKPAVAMTGS